MKMHKRSLRNVFVKPKFQLKLTLFFMVSGGLILGGVSLFVMHNLGTVQNLMNNPQMDSLVQSRINDLMFQCLEISLLGFAISIIFSSVAALVIGHRIAGPQIAIEACIEQLKLGNYDYQRNLRARDELTGIMDALQGLMPVLRDRDRTREHSS